MSLPPAAVAPRPAGQKPNVLIFFTDQQRHDTTGIHGNPLGLTPHFDRLAKAGTHVANSFTCQPVCGPARSCLQTGNYATQTGVWKNGIAIRPDDPTIAKAFSAAGYHTGYIGKWHLGERGQHGPVQKELRAGWQHWLAANAIEHTSDAYQTRLWDNDNNPVDLYGYRVDAQTDVGLDYIKQRRDEPFMLMVSYLEPHHQNHRDDYPAPDGLAELYQGRWTPPDLAALPGHPDSKCAGITGGTAQRDLAGYYGMVRRLDEALGRFYDALKSMGLLENTIILFTSDHACNFRTRATEYKRTCHESSIRVPTMFHGPGFMGGGERPELVSLVDLPATLMDAAGVKPLAPTAGRSLMPVLRRESADWPDHVYVQISEAGTGRTVRTKRWKYCVMADRDEEDGNGGAKVYKEAFLYDLAADPYELDNRIGMAVHRQAADALKARLLAKMKELGEPDCTIINAEEKHSGQYEVRPDEATA
ncbi:MAG: sulfatase-like hydrolase/transferase [Phycisphaerae bacterium]